VVSLELTLTFFKVTTVLALPGTLLNAAEGFAERSDEERRRRATGWSMVVVGESMKYCDS